MQYYKCDQQAHALLERIKKQEIATSPTLAIISVGSDPASEAYVRGKIKDAEYCDFKTIHISFGANERFNNVVHAVEELNKRADIYGIIVQQPLPYSPDRVASIISRIAPEKDVDGLTKNSPFVPCTAMGVMDIINTTVHDISGKMVLVIGRSKLAGKPIAEMALAQNATVTIAHSKTRNLNDLLPLYDIIVTAVGQRNLVDLQLCKQAELVVDVGITRADGKLWGDCYNMDNTGDGTIVTPVPGGVGLMTRAMLMRNLMLSRKMPSNFE